MKITIRKATAGDARSLFELNQEFNGVNATTEDLVADALKNNYQEIVFIAFVDEQAAGFICGQVCRSVCYRTLHGEIGELFVSEKYRQQGVGKQLMNHMEEEFRKNQAVIVTLATSVQNKTAQLFYEHCGYTGKQKYIYRKNIL